MVYRPQRVGCQVPLPLCEDLLSQGPVLNPQVAMLQVAAWRLSGTDS